MQLSKLFAEIQATLTCAKSTKNCYKYRINYLIKHGGDIAIRCINESYFNTVRSSAKAAGNSSRTIENSIKDVVLLLKRIGHIVDKGTTLKLSVSPAKIITLKQFDAALLEMPDWLKTFCAINYATGLRRNDIRSLDLSGIGDELTLIANKTSKLHRFPIPKWCQRAIEVDNFPKDENTFYRHLKKSCKSAGVPYFTPKNIRVLSARTWDKVSRGLGPLVLGHSLPGWSAATPFYLDASEPLFDRSCDFPASPSLLTTKERCAETARRERIIRLIDRLDAKKQETILTVAEGLVG